MASVSGAININPFHNPYAKADLVIPELASSYLDRSNERTGMVTPAIVQLFADISRGWGDNWSSADAWMHFAGRPHGRAAAWTLQSELPS